MSSKQEVPFEDLGRLAGLDLCQLRNVWAKHLGSVPAYKSADLMRLHLAYELQVRTYGGVNLLTRRRLRRLYRAFKTNPQHIPLSKYYLRPGTVLTREWKGTVHRVAVMDEGFEYKGMRHRSLSAIAQLISGTKWSGPVFFGFRATPPIK